jgi:hypothetical protein
MHGKGMAELVRRDVDGKAGETCTARMPGRRSPPRSSVELAIRLP